MGDERKNPLAAFTGDVGPPNRYVRTLLSRAEAAEREVERLREDAAKALSLIDGLSVNLDSLCAEQDEADLREARLLVGDMRIEKRPSAQPERKETDG